MAEMGKYCKAYHVRHFRPFQGWKADLDNLRPETRKENNEEIVTERTELGDDDVLYLQENYVVTDGPMKDEYIVFDQVTDEWKEFCSKELQFEIPEYLR